ncbi:MAG: sulfatase [Planctomycetota bacterium]
MFTRGGIFLCIILMFQGCFGDPQVLSPLVRWFEPDQIASVDTDRWDIHKGNFVLQSDGLSSYHVLNKESNWYAFFPPAETAGDPSAVEVPDLSDAMQRTDSGFRAKPDRGFACVVPVCWDQRKTPDDQRVFVECRGGFSENQQSIATVIQFQVEPHLPVRFQAGALKKIVVSSSLQIDSLEPAKDGLSATRVITLHNSATHLLFLFMTCPHKDSYFEWARFTSITPNLDLLIERNEKAKDHPLINNDFFHDGVLYPSLFMVPRTAITFKEQNICEESRFQCMLLLNSDQPDPVKVTLCEGDGKGSGTVLLEQILNMESKGWVPVECGLGLCRGEKRRFTLVCDWVEKHDADLRATPVVFCGAPIVTHPWPVKKQGYQNLIILSIDTLRPDHLGCYGYRRPTSPTIDRFARENVLFKHVYSQSPYTLPSHVSLFTSQYPTTHGVYQEEHKIHDETDLLSEVLAKQGLATASFCNGGFLSHEYGFSQGFDLYCEVDPLGDRYMDGHALNPNRLSDGSSGSLNMAFEWAEKHKETPFFLFLHTFMVHDFLPPRELAEAFNVGISSDINPSSEERYKLAHEYYRKNGWTEKERTYFINMYDASIRAADDMFGELLAFLEKTGLKDNTLIVLTSDHGEEFMEHGGNGHSYTIYNELIKIPLMMRIPGTIPMPVEIESVVNQVDILPSVLELMDERGIPFSQGRSFVFMLRACEGSDRTVFAEVDLNDRSKRSCVIKDGWKYIKGDSTQTLVFPAPAEVELFHLSDDPGEQKNVADANPEVQEELKAIIEKMREDIGKFNETMNVKRDSSKKMSKKLQDVLRRQGYL